MITSHQVLSRVYYSEENSFRFDGNISNCIRRVAQFNLAASSTKDKIESWAYKYELFKNASGLIGITSLAGFFTIGVILLPHVLGVAASVAIIVSSIFLVFIPAGIIAGNILYRMREKFEDLI